MSKKLHWTSLPLLLADGRGLKPETTLGIHALAEFRRHHSMGRVCFGQTGGPHERLNDPSTWGPESPDSVDWTGHHASYICVNTKFDPQGNDYTLPEFLGMCWFCLDIDADYAGLLQNDGEDIILMGGEVVLIRKR